MNQPLQELLANQDFAALEVLELQDSQRSQIFGITEATVSKQIRERWELFEVSYDAIAHCCNVLGFSVPIQTLWQFWLPLGIQIAAWRELQQRCLIQGFLGGQGTGKTTLTKILAIVLQQLGYQAISWSIDDLYLLYADRLELQRCDPRLVHRGPPGTHDVELGIEVLQQFRQGEFPIALPRFDKSLHQGAGDRTVADRVDRADIVLFEGWFLGMRPIDPTLFEAAPAPIQTDDDRQFARDMNDRLNQYLALWDLLDRLIVLYVPDYRLNQHWRKQAEHKMIAAGKSGMSDRAIDEFVEYFWKALHPELFIPSLMRERDRVEFAIQIDSDHSPHWINKFSEIVTNPAESSNKTL